MITDKKGDTMISRKDYILNKINVNNGNINKLLTDQAYKEYLRDTQSSANYASYRKEVYRDFKFYNPELFEDSDMYPEYDEDKLIHLLEEEEKLKQRKLLLSDIKEIAEKEDIPYQVLIDKFPNIHQLIAYVHKIHGGVKDETQISQLKTKVKLLEKELSFYKKKYILDDAFIDRLNDVIEIYAPSNNVNFIIDSKSDRELVALISDTHLDEIVDLEETHGINEYNLDIVYNRLDRLFSRIIENGKELSCSVLNLYFLGDIVSSFIHLELLMTSDVTVTTGIIEIIDYLAMWIKKLREYFTEIKCLGIVGNHGRFLQKPNFKKKVELNFEYLLYEFLNREVKNLVSEFIIPKSAFKITRIFETGFLNIHGDTFKGGNGMAPISSSINRDIAKLAGILRNQGMNFNYVNMAHFHTDTETKSFDGIPIIVNGSLIGATEYSINAIKRADRPSQTTYVVEKGKGVRFKDVVYLD